MGLMMHRSPYIELKNLRLHPGMWVPSVTIGIIIIIIIIPGYFPGTSLNGTHIALETLQCAKIESNHLGHATFHATHARIKVG
jgi:hypothetical protein